MESLLKKIYMSLMAVLPFLVLSVGSYVPYGIGGFSSRFFLSILQAVPRDPPICNFGCPVFGQVPIERPDRIPMYNGCGSYGFERLLVPEMDLFVDCCNIHDLCYGSCGASKFECDNFFQACILERYTSIVENFPVHPRLAANYFSTAQLLATAPVVAGCNAFIVAQTNSCFCIFLSESEEIEFTEDDFP